MSSRVTLRLGAAAIAVAAFCALGPGTALAQANNTVFDDDDDAPIEDAPLASDAEEEEKAQFGVLFRLRGIFVPNGLIELFVERSAGGVRELGFGGELVRRKGNFEISLGIEYERLEAGEGIWIDKGDEIPVDEPDYVEFDNFGWVTLDVNFVWTQEMADWIAFRYGAGIGLGFVLGDVLRTDAICTDNTVDSCTWPKPGAVNNATPEDDIPPVWPVVHLLTGLQIRPIENIAINIEGGLRSLPMFFVGTSIGYFF